MEKKEYEEQKEQKCLRLQDFNKIQIAIISEHLDEHKWFRHIKDKNEAICDFIGEFGWLMREIYCRYLCKESNCEIWKNIN